MHKEQLDEIPLLIPVPPSRLNLHQYSKSLQYFESNDLKWKPIAEGRCLLQSEMLSIKYQKGN